MPKGVKVTRSELERAARMYRTNKDAFHALGIGEATFMELCRKYGAETPGARKRRKREEWSSIRLESRTLRGQQKSSIHSVFG